MRGKPLFMLLSGRKKPGARNMVFCKNTFPLIIAALVLAALAAVALTAGLAVRNSLLFLPRPERRLEAEREILEPHMGRHMEHITLRGGRLGETGFALSLPSPRPKGKIPVLIVLGGLGKGENNLRYISYGGNNAIMGYDWPMPMSFPEEKDFPLQVPRLYRRVIRIPGQIVSAVHWLSRQPWADPERISILGFSFGALAAPAVQALAEREGIKVGWTILAYGGAPLGPLFLFNSTMQPEWLRRATAAAMDVLLYPLEPSVILPRLQGKFLILEGKNDEYVPEEMRRCLREAVPEPKTVLVFPGTHIGVGPESLMLLQEVISASRAWLVENKAVEP